MLALLQQEGKKLWTKKGFLLYGCCILMGMLIPFLSSYTYLYYSSETTYVRGPQAIEHLQQDTITGDMETVWKDSYTALLETFQNPEMRDEDGELTMAGSRYLQPYQQIVDIQASIYPIPSASLDRKDISFQDVSTLQQAFWKDHLTKQGCCPSMQEVFLNERSIPSSFIYEPTQGIQSALSNMSYFMISLMIFFAILLTPLFASERSSHMDVFLLSTKYGRKQTILAKAITAFLAMTLFYLIAILIYTIFAILVLHMQVSRTPYTLSKETLFSYELLTYSSAYGKAIWLGYVGVLGIGGTAMCISAYSKRCELAILLSLGIVLLPISPLATILPKVIQLLCSSMLANAEEVFRSFSIFSIFTHVYVESDARIVLSILCFFLFVSLGCIWEYMMAQRKGLRV